MKERGRGNRGQRNRVVGRSLSGFFVDSSLRAVCYFASRTLFLMRLSRYFESDRFSATLSAFCGQLHQLRDRRQRRFGVEEHVVNGLRNRHFHLARRASSRTARVVDTLDDRNALTHNLVHGPAFTDPLAGRAVAAVGEMQVVIRSPTPARPTECFRAGVHGDGQAGNFYQAARDEGDWRCRRAGRRGCPRPGRSRFSRQRQSSTPITSGLV